MIKTQSFTADEIEKGGLQNWLNLSSNREYVLQSVNTVRRSDGNDILVVIMVPVQ